MGQVVTVTFYGTVDTDSTGTITNTVTVLSDSPDPNPDKASLRRLLPHTDSIAEPPKEPVCRRCGGFGRGPGPHLPRIFT